MAGVSLNEARSASERIWAAAEKLQDMLVQYDEADAMNLPDRQRRELVADIDGEVAYLRRRLEVISEHTTQTKERHGW